MTNSFFLLPKNVLEKRKTSGNRLHSSFIILFYSFWVSYFFFFFSSAFNLTNVYTNASWQTLLTISTNIRKEATVNSEGTYVLVLVLVLVLRVNSLKIKLCCISSCTNMKHDFVSHHSIFRTDFYTIKKKKVNCVPRFHLQLSFNPKLWCVNNVYSSNEIANKIFPSEYSVISHKMTGTHVQYTLLTSSAISSEVWSLLKSLVNSFSPRFVTNSILYKPCIVIDRSLLPPTSCFFLFILVSFAAWYMTANQNFDE